MATTIATLAAKLTLDNRAFLAGFRQSMRASKSFGAAIGQGMASAVTSMGAAIAASVSLAGAIGRVSQSMESIDRGAKLADRLGLSNEAMQRLTVIAKAGNVDVEVLSKAMLTMGRNIGTGGKTLDERFFDVADAIAAIKDPAERSAKAQKIFGKAGDELINVLSEGSGRLRDSARLLDRFGLSMTRLDAAKVERANDALTRLDIVSRGLTDKFTVALSPVIEEFADRTLTVLENLGNALDRFGAKWDMVAGAMGGVIGQLDTIEKHPTLRMIFGAFGGAGSALMFDSKPDKKTGPNKRGTILSDLMGGDKATKAVKPGALHQNSVEAVRAIQNAGGNGMTGILPALMRGLRVLERIEANGDPMKGEGRGVVVTLREAAV